MLLANFRQLAGKKSAGHESNASLFDQLRVCVVSGRGLRNASASAFVQLRCCGVELRSVVARSDGEQVVWNDTLLFKLTPSSSTPHLVLDVDVWSGAVLDLWLDGVVSLDAKHYLGSTRLDDLTDDDAARRGVRALRRTLSLSLGAAPLRVGERAPLQCGELLLDVHYVRAGDAAAHVTGALLDDETLSPIVTPRDASTASGSGGGGGGGGTGGGIAGNGTVSGAAAGSGTAAVVRHRKLALVTLPLFRNCALCSDVCWGVAQQAYACGDCGAVFHRRCQPQAAQQSECVPGGATTSHSRRSSKPVDLEALDVAKKRKRVERCVQAIGAEAHVSAERVLELMTWLASAYDALSSDACYAALHAKPTSAGVVPLLLESLAAAKQLQARVVIVQLLQQLLYSPTNKAAVLGKGGVGVLLQVLREVQQQMQQSAGSGALPPPLELFVQCALALLVYLSSEETRAAFQRDGALDLFLNLCGVVPASNRAARYCLGALLIQYSLDDELWRVVLADRAALLVVVEASEQGVATLHREIRPAEVELRRSLFQSPLCEVLQGRWKGIDVAVKVFDVNSIAWSWSAFFGELAMLSIAQHPSVVRLYGAHSARSALKPFIVMELCAAGTLDDTIDAMVARGGRCTLTDAFCAQIGLELATALAFLHSKGVVHRDVKSGNFLVTEHGSIKMIDFGVSRISGERLLTVVGTPIWMAPEVLDGRSYDAKADVYSLGLVLSHLLTGREPFADVPPLHVGQRVIDGARPPLPRSSAPALRALLTRCWAPNDAERPTSADVARQLAELRVELREQPSALLALPVAAAAALFARCSLAMLGALASTSRALAAAVRLYRTTGASVPLDALGAAERPFLHAALSKQQANAMLRDSPQGTFLVRPSSLPNHFVLCGQFENRKLLQILIAPSADNGGGYGIDIDGDRRTYGTLLALLRSYRHVLKQCIVPPLWEPRTSAQPFTIADEMRCVAERTIARRNAYNARASVLLNAAPLPQLDALNDAAAAAGGIASHTSPRARSILGSS